MKRKNLLLSFLSTAFALSLVLGFSGCDLPDFLRGKEDEKAKSLEFALHESGSSYYVKGIGTLTDEKIVIPTTHEGLPVIEIGARAFYDCDGFTSVEIPDSIVTIGEKAFLDCGRLQEVTIPNSVTSLGASAFYQCEQLTRVVIGNGVRTIERHTFRVCSSLEEIVIPNGVCSIGGYVFDLCDSLTEIVIPSSVNSVDNDAFYGCKRLTVYCETAEKPDGWGTSWNGSCPVVWDCQNNDVAEDGYIYTIIDGVRYALKDGEATVVRQAGNLLSATIPSNVAYKNQTYSVTSIATEAFAGCDRMKSVIIGDNVTAIGDWAFSACFSLMSAEIGANVTTIGQGAFQLCVELTNISLGDKVVSIGEKAFSACDKLANITVGADNTTYCSIDGNLYSKDGTTLIQYAIGKKVETFETPVGLTVIGDEAFYDCKTLTGVVIGDSVISIGENAFNYCTNLTSVTIGSGVKLIEYAAFHQCTALKKIVIPVNVTTIGQGAFAGCENLTIYCEVEEKPDGWYRSWNSVCPVVWGYVEE